MLAASLLLVVMNVWLLRRRAALHEPQAHRDQVLAMGALVLSTLGAPALMILLLNGLTHGSELSNLGDGVLCLALVPLHFVGWPIVALVAGPRTRR